VKRIVYPREEPRINNLSSEAKVMPVLVKW
jgi:hypothetical protein